MSDLVARLRLEASGGDQSAAEVTKVKGALDSVPPAAQRAGAAVDKMGDQARGAAQDFATLYDAAQVDFVSQYVRQSQGMAKQNRLTANETLNLTRNLADVGVQAAMLQNPLMILIQQGPQIADVFQQAKIRGVGAGEAMGGIASQARSALGFITPLRAGMGGLIGVMIAATVAEIAYSNEMERLGELTEGVGRRSGLAAQNIRALAKANADEAGTSIAQAEALAGALLRTGKVGGEVFGDLMRIQQRYAIATGQELPDAQRELAASFADPARGADALAEKLGGVDRQTQQLIDSLMAQGRETEAQKVLAEAYERALSGVGATSQTLGGQLGQLGNAISDVSSRFGEAVNNAKLFIQLGPQAVATMKRQAADATARGDAMATINGASRAGGNLYMRLDPDAAARQALQGDVSTARRGLNASRVLGDFQGIQQNVEALERAAQAERSYLSVAEKAHRQALLDIQANELKAKTQTAATKAKLADIAAQKARLDTAGQALTRDEVEQRVRDARALAASSGGGGGGGARKRYDVSDQAIETATRAEVQARMALTRNVEQVAALKLQEIDAEQAIQRSRTERQLAEGSITKVAAETVLARQAEAAAHKRDLVKREEAAAVAARELEQRREMGGLLDRSASAQASMAESTEDAGRIALEILSRRQGLERAALAESQRSQVIQGQITEAEAFALAVQLEATQQAERKLAQQEQQERLARQKAALELAEADNQVDLLASQLGLVKSGVARNRVELQILKLQHQIERKKLEDLIASTASSDNEKAIAEARLRVLQQIQANEALQLEEQGSLLNVLTEATDAVSSFKRAFKSRDWAGALSQLQRTISTVMEAFQTQGFAGGAMSLGSVAAQVIGGKTGRAIGGGLGIAAAGLGASAGLVTAASMGALGSGLAAGLAIQFAPLLGPIGIAAGAIYAAVKLFNIGGKPSNKGAGYDLVTGQMSGNKRNEETDDAARKAGETIQQIQAAFREAGLELPVIIKGLVLGTRDQTQIYTSAGQTLLSAVGDVGAAVDTAMRAMLESAVYQSEGQKQLVQGLVAGGKGFDEIQEALASYAAGQKLPQQIQDAIMQLTAPKAWAIEELKRAQQEQRKGLQAAADAGYLTADQFATASAKLTELEGLQLEDVLERFSDAVEDTTEELQARASKLRGSIADRILELANPAAFRVKRINDDIDGQIAEAQPLIAAGVLSSEFLVMAEQLRSLELAKLADEVNGATDAFKEARPRLMSWIDQLRVGPAGELAPKAAREEALRQYQRELAKAQSGDTNALSNITSYADRLLETDRTATGSASARLALRNQVLGQIEGLAGRGATLTPAQAIQQLQAPLGQIAAASAAELATLTSAGKSVVIANLPSMQAMYGELVTTQTDRLVAANDRNAAEIVASVKALAEGQAAALSQLAASVEGAVGAALEVAAGQAAEVAAGLQAIADEARLTDARQRAAG